MTQSASEVVLFGLSLALPIGLFGLRQSLSRVGHSNGTGLPSTSPGLRALLRLSAVLPTGSVAILSGLAMGLAALPTIATVVDDAVSLLIVFASAWCGFTIGCGIDLRALRKTSSVLLARQLGQCIVALSAIPLLTWALTYLPRTSASALYSPVALLIVIGMCLSDGMGLHDREHRQRTPAAHKGPPKTSIAAFVAILLVSLGAGHDVLGSTHMAGVSFLPVPSLVWTITGIGERMLWGLAMGCGTGLLCDLAAKDHAPTGVTFGVLAGVLLLVSGIALAFGIQPLLIGGMAGVWVINATLRRLDIHHVIEKSSSITSIGVPFVLGWTIGHGVNVYGINGKAFLAGLCLILAVRPIVRMAGWRVGEFLIKARNSAARSGEGESVLFDTSGFLIALVLTMTISGSVGVSFLAAALVSQLTFAVISMCWPPSTVEARSAS